MHSVKQLLIVGVVTLLCLAGCKSTGHRSKVQAVDDDHLNGWTFLPVNTDQRPIVITIDGQDDIVRYVGEGEGGVAYRRDSNGRILKVPYSHVAFEVNILAERDFFFDFPQRAAANPAWSAFAEYIVKSESALFTYQNKVSPLSIQKDFAAGKALKDMTDSERSDPTYLTAIKEFSDNLNKARNAGACIMDMSDDNMFYDAQTGKLTVIDGIFKKNITYKNAFDRDFLKDCLGARWCREKMSPDELARAQMLVNGSPIEPTDAVGAADAADSPDASAESRGSSGDGSGAKADGKSSDGSRGAGGR